MATDINVVVLSGRITADSIVKDLGNGNTLLSFSVAVNRSQKGADGNYIDVASFFNVSYFTKGAVKLSQYIKKGVKVTVSGSLNQDRWESNGEKHSVVNIRADNVSFEVNSTSQNNVPNNQIPAGVTQVFNQQPQQYQQQVPNQQSYQTPMYHQQYANQYQPQPATVQGFDQNQDLPF